MTAMRNRTVELLRVPAGELRGDPRNWRKHPAGQRKALQAVLADVGFAGAVLARRDAKGALVLIDGHLRIESVAPETELPVLVLDVDEAEAAKILATYDPLSAMADRDNESFAKLLKSLEEAGDPIMSLVFPDHVLAAFRDAEWRPPDAGNLAQHVRGSDMKAIDLTPEQLGSVMKAVEALRKRVGEAEMPAGRALEMICREWLER